MGMQELIIKFERGDDWTTLHTSDQHVIEAAISSAQNAYVPYSDFRVGAAILREDNKIILGNNQENAAYPMCTCAEQVAITKSFSDDPNVKIKLIAVFAHTHEAAHPASPCGSCRQIMSEVQYRQKQPFSIILVNEHGHYMRFDSIEALLPFGFDGFLLGK